MNKTIIEMALNNEKALATMKRDIESFIRFQLVSSKIEDKKWYYDTTTKEFYAFFDTLEIGANNWKYFKYEKFYFNILGLKVEETSCDAWDDIASIKIVVPSENENEITSQLSSNLKEYRQTLYTNWRKKMAKLAMDYFEIHKENYLKYPTNYLTISSNDICIWTNGADVVKPCHKIVELMETTCNHSLVEWLSAKEYAPVIWENNEQLENTLTVFEDGNGFKLHFLRRNEITESLFDYPAIFMTMEMISIKDIDYQNVFLLQERQRIVEGYQHFMNAIDFFKKADWFMSEDNKPYAIVPLVFSETIDFVFKQFKRVYGDDFKLSLVEREIPLWGNEVHKCIKVESR